MKHNLFRILFLFFVTVLVSSCVTTNNVPKGEYLYTNSSYTIKGEKVKNHNIPSFYKQKQNRKVLYARPWVWMYDVGKSFKDSTKIQHFLCDVIGEKPILYDSTLIKYTAENIKQHMHNLGYYNAEIFTQTTLRDSLKMASVKYIIYPKPAYYLRNIDYNIENKSINSFVKANWKNSKLDTGKVFTTNALKLERERITKDLQNLGYYYFSKKQISFSADSNFNDHRIDLTIKIDPISIQNKDSIRTLENKQYKYNRVYIYPEVAEINSNNKLDTTIIKYNTDNVEELDYYFIHNGPIKVNPESIINAIFIKPERLYREENVAYSYKALFNLSIYKYININTIDTKNSTENMGSLDCIIELSKSDKFSINTESELKNTGGNFGVEQGVSLITRNTFKGGEVLNVSLRGALEVQNVSNDNEINKILKVFNTFEAGVNASLDIPRFLAPVKRNFFSRYFNPKTRISLGYNYQDRPDYSRYIINSNFGYTWIKNTNVSQILNPLEISSVKINPTAEFQETINSYGDPRIKYSYQDHLVLGMSYSYLHNERKWNSKTPFKFFFAKVDLGGIPFASISNLMGSTKDPITGEYWVMGLPYSQFARAEVDYRYYFPMAQGSMMNVFRVNLGIGVPLFGSEAIPFEKSFFIGGANSLRAWSIGSLGPGSYNSESNTFEMTGDIKMEFNYEFRFPISENLKGALFTDIGNIYLLDFSSLIKGGAFYFDDFYKKLAADIGYGIRYDLSFLVIRFDIAHPIYQPYYEEGKKWNMRTEGDDSKLIFGYNFAIGYPF